MNMAKRDRFWRSQERRANQKAAEAAGLVADSMEVRIALIQRFDRGEITFDEMQAEIKQIKRGAKATGKMTRAQAYR